MVFDAHDRAFALFKATCSRGIYDNMKVRCGAVEWLSTARPARMQGELAKSGSSATATCRCHRYSVA
jgi:hypothetical protein